VGHIAHLEKGIRAWLEEHEFESVRQMQGSMSQLKCANPAAFERAQYIRALQGYSPAPLIAVRQQN